MGEPVPARVDASRLGDACQEVLNAALPGLNVYVANALFAVDRGRLTALWKAHRARFVAAGQLEPAAGASSVVSALANLPAGDLAGVQAVTDKGDFLLWVDLRGRSIIAAFANSSPLLGGL